MNIQARSKDRLRDNRGQNVIEYLLVVVAIVFVVIAFMNTQNGPMKNALDNVFSDTVNDIQGLNRELKFSN
jgi:Flp pilus assembly pilin Flp